MPEYKPFFNKTKNSKIKELLDLVEKDEEDLRDKKIDRNLLKNKKEKLYSRKISILKEIDTLKEELKQCEEELPQIENSLRETEIAYENLQKELSVLKKKADPQKDKYREMLLEDYRKRIFLISKENSCVHSLYYDTATTPIIDDYYKSECFFLVIRDFFGCFYNICPYYSINLVITRGYYNISKHKIPAPTMTEIKRFASSGHIADRLDPLIEEIISVLSKIKAKFGLCIPFEKPYPLGKLLKIKQDTDGNGDLVNWREKVLCMVRLHNLMQWGYILANNIHMIFLRIHNMRII